MPQFGKFKVSVVVDGEPLPEYSTTIAEATKTIACWIPSQEGKAFSVNFEGETHTKDIRANITIDGEWIRGKTYKSRGTIGPFQCAQVSTSPTTCRELLFSRMELTDDDAFLNANVIGLGEISLSVWDGIIRGVSSRGRTYKTPETKVHERSKKALGHKVKYGKEMTIKPRTYTRFKEDELLATFVFKYRPIDILRADGIAPPDPTATKRKADEAEDDENEEEGRDKDKDQNENYERELKALLHKANAIQAKVNKIQDQLAKKTKPQKKMKTEPRSSLISGEVIDLT